MQMNPGDIRIYPKLAYYVKNNLPDIMKVPVIVTAIQRIGQLNAGDLSNALQWRRGPIILVTALVHCGEFTPYIGSNEIRLNVSLVRDFEAGRGIAQTTQGGNVYVVGVTILHELIHWADDQNNVDRRGEEGEEFEIAVFGRIIPC